MATAAFTSAQVLPNGREIKLVFTLSTSSWAGTITADLAGGDAVEILFPSGIARYAVIVASTAISGANRVLTATMILDSPIYAGQEIDGLYIAEALFTDTSGDITPSVVTSSITNNSVLAAGGLRNRGFGRYGVRGR